MKLLASTVIAIALSLGIPVTASAMQPHHGNCAYPAAVNGTTVSISADGSASAPYTGGPGLKCSDGTWVTWN